MNTTRNEKRLHMRVFPLIGAILALSLTFGGPLGAQNALDTVITVNDSAITAFELDQRRRLLEIFRTPGDLDKAARDGLIEDRLKESLMTRAGLILTEESLQTAMDDFAGRANLSLDQFLTVLKGNGVAPETLRDFVKVGVSWRDYIRSRYSNTVTVTDAEVARAMAQTGANGSEIEVLLSEIIIAAPPPRAAAAMARAQAISKLRSTSAFEAQAREVSALPSRTKGGRLDWLPLSNYPPQLHSLILALSPGEVTAPLPIPNGVALFQLRAVREAPTTKIAPTAIDYATFYLAGGLSPAGLSAAQTLADSIDTCDDLYTQARGQSADVLTRTSLAPADIPQDVALELARMDAGEYSYNLTRNNGDTLVFLMLCGRDNPASEGTDPDAVRNQILSQRLAGLASSLVEDLRASATITTR